MLSGKKSQKEGLGVGQRSIVKMAEKVTVEQAGRK